MEYILYNSFLPKWYAILLFRASGLPIYIAIIAMMDCHAKQTKTSNLIGYSA